ncbi:MAG: DUF3842 family protein [Clostridia bacterium]|jgi:hypothetical protein|nr:DUF3842 family protein [Clostridia bacterium]MCI1999192.1 DUF3842 family protein [Clostridia bacterium]MCI2014855.1 DUF3842 family protein [Clostridia bacterium]
MVIMIVDGQGGGIGKSIIEKLKGRIRPTDKIIAVGTNSTATANMMKSGATAAATGENAVVVNSRKANIIVGSIGIISSNAMYGELTSKMAQAISESNAEKVLIPIKRCGLNVVGVAIDALPKLIDDAVETVCEFIKADVERYC